MIKIDNIEVMGWEPAIRGMRNPMNSWDKSDSGYEQLMTYPTKYKVGPNDLDLMMRLAKGGSTHAKYRRMITVYMDITAPLYWWHDMDIYKVGIVKNSCSTKHKIHAKEFVLDDFSHDHLDDGGMECLKCTIENLNWYRDRFLQHKNKDDWYHMQSLLPWCYNQKATMMLNYEVLANIYRDRKDHKLDEFRDFCQMIKSLPHAQIITLEEEE